MPRSRHFSSKNSSVAPIIDLEDLIHEVREQKIILDVITVYEPSPARWEPDFKRRKP